MCGRGQQCFILYINRSENYIDITLYFKCFMFKAFSATMYEIKTAKVCRYQCSGDAAKPIHSFIHNKSTNELTIS